MAATGTPTPNIGLRIPQGTDPASVDDINYNSNLLDTKLGAVGNDSVQDQIDALNSKTTPTSLTAAGGDFTFATSASAATQFVVSKAINIIFAQCIAITVSNSFSAWSTLLTFASSHKPLSDVFIPIVSGVSGYLQITSSGNVIPSVTIPDGTTIRCAPASWRT